MNKNYKTRDTFFRLVLLITAAVTIFLAVKFTLIMVDNSKEITTDKDAMLAFFKLSDLFYASLIGTIISVILSVFAGKFSGVGAVIIRTFFLAVIVGVQIFSLPFVNMINAVGKLYDEYGPISTYELKTQDYEDLGISEEMFEKIVNEEDPDASMYAFIIIIYVAAFFMAIFAITSLVSLFKKKATNMTFNDFWNGDVMDIANNIGMTNGFAQNMNYQNTPNNSQPYPNIQNQSGYNQSPNDQHSNYSDEMKEMDNSDYNLE